MEERFGVLRVMLL